VPRLALRLVLPGIAWLPRDVGVRRYFRGMAPAPAILFEVVRRCAEGTCPQADRGSRTVDVRVDELGPEELTHFQIHGSEAERLEVLAWYDGERSPAELLAGRRDGAPVEGP
jgi:hypothetical protein